MKRINFKLIIGLSIFMGLIFTIMSCKKDEPATGTDKQLLEMAEATAGFTWYKHSDALLNKSSGSGHPQSLLRTRYNSIAAEKLDQNGKVVEGAMFDEGSLIVKELYGNASSLERYAILYKQTSNPDADERGWVWGYVDVNGTVAAPASNKGSSCISCHLQADNIDYMLMNKYFP
jgi:hypothetical protein